MHSPNTHLDNIFARGQKRSFKKGEVIQSTDYRESITQLSSGFVKRYLITKDGTISVQSVYGAGQIFPLTLVFKLLFDQVIYEGREEYYYEAMTDITLKTVPHNLFISEAQANPGIYKEILRVTGVRLLSNIQRLENVSLHPVTNRLAHQLASYAKQFGIKTAGGVRIPIPLKHHDLAADLDVTRETVSHSMKELQQHKLIKTNKYIIVPSLKRLYDKAYS